MNLVSTQIVEPSGAERSFWMRDGTSDIPMAQQAFGDNAFNLMGLKRWPDIVKWLDKTSNPLIVDAGANIGTAAVYLALSFPCAQIVSLEPEPSNFDLLKKNTVGLNVACLPAALASRMEKQRLYHPHDVPIDGCGHAGFRTTPDEQGTIPGRSMDFLLKAYPGTPFLAKIDIEGAEADIFSFDLVWIDCFPLIMVELHDWLYPKQGLSGPFLRAVADSNRDFIIHGEHIVSISNDLL